MVRLMVQGDRNAEGIEKALKVLGQLCKEEGIGLNVGESGEIVNILAESCPNVRVHMAKEQMPNIGTAECYEAVNCHAMAKAAMGELRTFSVGGGHPEDQPRMTFDRLAWGIRLVTMIESSKGFIFFHGREGTLAHLIPILAFIKKGEVDQGVARPRRVVLIGWEVARSQRLIELFEFSIKDISWFATFPSDEMQKAVDWLTEGLPA